MYCVPTTLSLLAFTFQLTHAMMYLGVNMGTLAHLHSTLQSFAMTMARVNGDVKLSLHGEQFDCSPALGVIAKYKQRG